MSRDGEERTEAEKRDVGGPGKKAKMSGRKRSGEKN